MKSIVLAFFFAFVGTSFANRYICPHPEETGNLVAEERLTLGAPQAGHAILELDLTSRVLGRELACFTLTTESQNAGPHIVSLGKNVRGGFSVKIYSEDRRGIQASLQAYTPRVNADLESVSASDAVSISEAELPSEALSVDA